jgi:hypothetical protein
MPAKRASAKAPEPAAEPGVADPAAVASAEAPTPPSAGKSTKDGPAKATGKSKKSGAKPAPDAAETPAGEAPAGKATAGKPAKAAPAGSSDEPAAADVAVEEGDSGEDAASAAMNRAERRALAKRKGAPVPVGQQRQVGRTGPAPAQAHRHWQGRRGG